MYSGLPVLRGTVDIHRSCHPRLPVSHAIGTLVSGLEPAAWEGKDAKDGNGAGGVRLEPNPSHWSVQTGCPFQPPQVACE